MCELLSGTRWDVPKGAHGTRRGVDCQDLWYCRMHASRNPQKKGALCYVPSQTKTTAKRCEGGFHNDSESDKRAATHTRAFRSHCTVVKLFSVRVACLARNRDFGGVVRHAIYYAVRALVSKAAHLRRIRTRRFDEVSFELHSCAKAESLSRLEE